MNKSPNTQLIIKPTSFNIEKLYLDCIDDLGNCFIIYRAEVQFFIMSIDYSGIVFCNTEGLTSEKSSLRRTKKPEINTTIEFPNIFLHIYASLKRIDDPIIKLLYKDSENNELIWHCHHPKALAEIKYDGKIYKGFGYAETLFSPVKPWNLPIDELRWGRFLSDSYTLIWISWKGKFPVNKIFFNSSEYNDAIFEDDAIIFGDRTYQLKFSEIQVIRRGKLSRLFTKMKLIKIFFNRRILNSFETKYKSKTSLSENSMVVSTGWSLFEIVTWGK